MKKHTIIIGLLIMTFLFGGIFYNSNKVGVNKQKVKENASVAEYATGRLSLYLYLNKQDEKGNFLDDVRFLVSSYNDTFSGTSSYEDNNYVVNEYEEGERYFEDAYNTLSYEQQQLVNSIHTEEDLERLSSDYPIQCSSPVEQTYLSADSIPNDSAIKLGGCKLFLPTVFTVEETKAPAGYIKEKYYIPGSIVVRYSSRAYAPKVNGTPDSESIAPQEVRSSNVYISDIYVETGNPQYVIPYGNIDINELVGTDANKIARIWRTQSIDLECNVVLNDFKETVPPARNTEVIAPQNASFNSLERIFFYYDEGPYTCFVNHQGTIELNAKAYVNNSDSATIQVNQTLEYKVSVENTGSGDAIDNVVRLTVPEGFIYIEGSASDNGYYRDGYVEWNVERINVGSTRELSFKAYAPNGVPVGHEYIGKATVDNASLDKQVESNQTMVRLSFQNPYTKAPIGLLVVIGAFIFSVVLCSIQRKQESK